MALTRRSVVCSLLAAPAAWPAAKFEPLPPEWTRFPDPATEWDILRLTNPEFPSGLPAYYNRGISRRGTFLLFWSVRGGSAQAYRMDLKTGAILQLTDFQALDPASPSLMPDDKGFCCFDGRVCRHVSLVHPRVRDIATVSEGWERSPGGGLSRDGNSVAFAESRAGKSRLWLVSVAAKTQSLLGEFPFPASDPVSNPRRAQVLYRQGDEALWLVNSDGQQNRKLRTAPGKIGPAIWSPDGRSVLYLSFPEEARRLFEIRETIPDENRDRLIAPTSQFVHFGANSDASVFVGASRNVNSPHVLIILRVTRRELTVCEHKASNPGLVAPQFAPDNRYIFFQSDRHGRQAIYRVRVEKFVEPAEEDK
jgi:oligogalacturonide lyase